MKKIIALLTALFVLGMTSAAFGAVSLYSGIGSRGVLSGGLRVDLGPNLYTQISGAANSGETGTDYLVGADVFYGCLGVGVVGTANEGEDSTVIVNAKYAIEKSITKDIKVGVAATILSVDTSNGADPSVYIAPDFNTYIVLPF